MHTNKPGLIVRVGNLIVIQVIFIFAAVMLILLSPDRQQVAETRLHEMEEGLDRLGQVASRIAEDTANNGADDDTRQELTGLLSRADYVTAAALARVTADSQLTFEYVYEPKPLQGGGMRQLCYGEFEDMRRHSQTAQSRWSLLLSNHLVNYQRLGTSDDRAPVFLVSVVDHGLLMAPRNGLFYALLVLFLFSTLISLLTVSLMWRRFRQPLERLIRGFEKTAQGELYHLVEPEDDPELGKLAGAYNRMVRQLWENHGQLRDYNTKLKRSNYYILESQLFLATVVDSSPLSVVVVNRAEQVILFNRAASEVFGYTPDEIIGEPVSKLIAESTLKAACNETAGKRATGFEVIGRRKDGEMFPAFVASANVATQDQSINATLYMCRDISESKNFQDMMVRLDRYYTRGQMAGDIAHEINNYLAVLMGNLELMPILLRKGDQEKIDRKLNVMHETVDKIARFANGLMDVPQDDVLLEPSSLNQIVENVVAFLKPQNRFDMVEVATELSPDLPVLMLDQGQIQQLLVNLIYNAADALSKTEGHKRIEITTSGTTTPEGSWVNVEVRDSGSGVNPEKIEALFKDRFTTKRKGHGIGLITCRKIAGNHGGQINYRTDNGAVFTVSLPLSHTDAPAPGVTTGAEAV